jgi:hypothetical protein
MAQMGAWCVHMCATIHLRLPYGGPWYAYAAEGGELVADPLADDLALELCEAEHDIERQPAHRSRGVAWSHDRKPSAVGAPGLPAGQSIAPRRQWRTGCWVGRG